MSIIENKRRDLERTGFAVCRPKGPEMRCSDGKGTFRDFEHVSIYARPGRGTLLIYGLIREKWTKLGRENGPHGFPITSEEDAGSGRGRFNNFENGTIIWRKGTTEAFSVYGLIFQKWGQLGWDSGTMGFPTTDESDTAGNAGRYNNFEQGAIVWKKDEPEAFGVYGAIYKKWGTTGWDSGALGYPISDEAAAQGGRFSEFESGAIYYRPQIGTCVIRSPLLAEWTMQGRERGSLGYPTADTTVSGDTQTQVFERGTLTTDILRKTAIYSDDIHMGIEPRTRACRLKHARQSDDRTLPLQRLDSDLTLRVGLVIFRESYSRKFQGSEISDLVKSYTDAMEQIDQFTHGQFKVRYKTILINDKLKKSSFANDDQDGNPATFDAQFQGYSIVEDWIKRRNHKLSEFDVVPICIPWSQTGDRPSGFAWANPRAQFSQPDVWSSIQHIYPGRYWWAVFVHELFHSIEWMFERRGYPALRNPDDPAWTDWFPKTNGKTVNGLPLINNGDPGEYLLQTMLHRIKERWRDLSPSWGTWTTGRPISSQDPDLLCYEARDPSVLVETAVRSSIARP